MNTYRIRMEVTSQHDVDVEASTEDEAWQRAEDLDPDEVASGKPVSSRCVPCEVINTVPA